MMKILETYLQNHCQRNYGNFFNFNNKNMPAITLKSQIMGIKQCIQSQFQNDRTIYLKLAKDSRPNIEIKK